ncbi:MAG: PPA1309 family protein, partial [Nocardioides sp.]
APDSPLERVLESVTWPPSVSGCAAVVERLVLPPKVDADIPEDPTDAERFAREHPERQEVRIVAGATRGGSTYCALRMRAHDDDLSVVGASDLVPGLLQLLAATLEDE